MQYTEELDSLAELIERAFAGDEMDPSWLDQYAWDDELFSQMEPILKKKAQNYQNILEWIRSNFHPDSGSRIHSLESWRVKRRNQQKAKTEKLLQNAFDIMEADYGFLQEVVQEEVERYGTRAADYLRIAMAHYEDAMNYLYTAVRELDEKK